MQMQKRIAWLGEAPAVRSRSLLHACSIRSSRSNSPFRLLQWLRVPLLLQREQAPAQAVETAVAPPAVYMIRLVVQALEQALRPMQLPPAMAPLLAIARRVLTCRCSYSYNSSCRRQQLQKPKLAWAVEL